ncbi:MAG TPA: DUF3883 domain-containing protein [Anaerolineae bacterium]|nr:DUF3883 domain-containing protein [Anaerolineae bacterium]HQK13236.1 DUF3883 domain-containing protein [Anaerolineae bacterium]
MDYVQYHNSEKMGFSCLEFSPDDGFGIVTNKRISANLLGNRIWLIGGIEKPRQYYLCYNFIADEILELDDEFGFEVNGREGQFFQPPVLLNDFPWFKDFLKSQASFSLGLQRIDEKFVRELEKVAVLEQSPSPLAENSNKASFGGGFGSPEVNRQVEQAAIKVVTEYYQERGWNVESVESQKCGYDLLCTKDTAQEHVEVKGVQGDGISFIITSGEVKQSQSDKNFVLCVVTQALEKPILNHFTSKEFAEKFLLEPISYRAIKK